MKKTVLVTGAAGMVGYEVIKQLINNKYNVIAVDLPTKLNRKRLNKYKDYIKIIYDSIITNKLSIIKEVDYIIHLAAVIPPLADKNHLLTKQVNFFGTKNIITSIKKYNPKCFLLYSSSVSVYGDRINNPYISISDKLKPSEGDYYAVTKIETELLIQKSNINHTIFRLTGIMGRPKIDPLMFHMPLNTKIEIASTSDTARAFINSLEYTTKLNKKVFNLAGGKECQTTYRNFLKNMFKLYGLNKKFLKEIAFAEKNFHCGYYLDSDKLNDIINFRQDNLTSYYNKIKIKINPIIKIITIILSQPILYFLTKKSDPLQAILTNNIKEIEKYYNNINILYDKRKRI